MSKNEQILKDFLKKGDNKKCFVCGQNVSPFLRGLIVGSPVYCNGFLYSGV